MRESTARPTFHVLDDDWRFVTIESDDYLSFNYSGDGNWLTFWFIDIYGRPYQETYYIGFPT